MMQRFQQWTLAIALGTSVVVGGGYALAAKPAPQPPAAPLSDAAAKLETRYAAMLNELKSDITKSLPTVSQQDKAAFLKAHQEEMTARANLHKAEGAFGDISKGNGLIGHANWWINDSKQQIAKAQAELKKATTDAARATAQKTLDDQTKRMRAGEEAMKERKAALDKAKLEEPRLIKERDAAKAALQAAIANTQKAMEAVNLVSILKNDALDSKLIKFEVLFGATPKGLAEFAAQGPQQEALVEKLLADEKLMREMVYNDGPNSGKYGRAMQIYTAIQAASPKAATGNLQRLALAIALEHATPIAQSNPAQATDAPKTVDPVKRYLAIEKAFLAGELDPAFKNLSAWEYRFAVDGDEPDAVLAWGREMLRNYHPDQVTMADYNWRYVDAVRSEVNYGSGFVKDDRPSLQNYQNIVSNGGVCGRRAFFGRFILRSFGMPTVARPQSGHAALAHWTPAGWVLNLGAGWGSGWTKTIYNEDVNFLAVAQGRGSPEGYLQVQRAHWIGDVVGEKRSFGLEGKTPANGFWNLAAIGRRQEVIKQINAKTLAAVGTELGEADPSKASDIVKKIEITGADRKVSVGANGIITLPAAATSKPTNSTAGVVFMPAAESGLQMHLRNGRPEPFEYTFDAPAAGKYALTAKLVTVSDKTNLSVTVNNDKQPIEISVPYTVGMWDHSPAVEVTLLKGKNTLQFNRSDKVKGITLKEFTLTPVK